MNPFCYENGSPHNDEIYYQFRKLHLSPDCCCEIRVSNFISNRRVNEYKSFIFVAICSNFVAQKTRLWLNQIGKLNMCLKCILFAFSIRSYRFSSMYFVCFRSYFFCFFFSFLNVSSVSIIYTSK